MWNITKKIFLPLKFDNIPKQDKDPSLFIWISCDTTPHREHVFQ